MKTEKEIRRKLKACRKVASWVVSDGPCPFNKDKSVGYCSDCTTLQTLLWVLDKKDD